MDSKRSDKILYLLIFLTIIIWGGTWTSAKLVAGQVDSNILVFWRFLITFISFVPVVIFSKAGLKLTGKSLFLIIVGALLMTAYNQLFFRGLKTGFAGAGSVIVTTLNPIFTYLLSIIFFKNRVGIKEVAGLVIGFIGGLIIIQIWEVSFSKLLLSGNLFFLIAAFCWASMTVTSQLSKNHSHSFTFSLYVYALSALLNLIISFDKGVLEIKEYSSSAFWLNILYLSIVATTFAVTVYFYSSTRLGAYKTGSFMFCVPLSALFLSWLILDEVPTLSTVCGGLITILAVYLINVKRGKNEAGEQVSKPAIVEEE